MITVPGGDVVARMLAAEGVEKVFGIIDGTYFGLYASLAKHGIQLIGPRHETSAVHMAGAYARATGKLGVCIASNGPGVANALPGVAVEQGEGNRVLLVTSSRREGIINPDRGGTYQCFDQTGVTRAMSKWSVAVPSRDRIPELMRRAFRASWTGRPGVVHVDVPESILNGKADFDETSLTPPARYRATEPIEPSASAVERAAEMLIEAEAPMIHAGSGVLHAGAFEELQMAAELLQAPVTTSWGARGVLPETSPCAIPMIHVELNNTVRNEADVVLALGSRIGETDWWGKAPNWRPATEQRMVQVDVDESVLGLNKPLDLAVLADAKVFLRRLFERLAAEKDRLPLGPRRERIARYRAVIAAERARLDRALEKATTPMHTAQVANVCQEVLPEDTLWVFDGGNTAVWANFFHTARRPRALFATFKFGMLGAGVGQALGAQAARPGATVCCVIGDGAMGMQQQEVETAVRNGLNVIYVVVCDRQWGMVKMNQQFMVNPFKALLTRSLGPEETINADLSETRFDLLGQAMGAYGERVSSAAELRGAISRARKSGKPAVLHVDVNNVDHMWAPGLLHFKQMHQEPAGVSK
jgi:acetolactate synthase-1/2/3 large subunit